jgi:hypothetical protein
MSCFFVCHITGAKENEHLALYHECKTDSLKTDTALYFIPQKKQYLLPAAEITGGNILLFCFNRFVLNENFSHVTMNVIKDNIRTGFVWDNDAFYTDMLSHPYNGNMYFNIARSNGLSYWESMAYNAAGSMEWEMFGENEPPAIQDWFSTTFGGSCVGEIANRISLLFLDDRTHGFNRFVREGSAMIVNPMLGIKRLLAGESTKIRQANYLYHNYDAYPIDFHASVGGWYMAENGNLSHGKLYPYININLDYGDVIEGTLEKPFDYFNTDITFAIAKNKPLVNSIRILGSLFMSNVYEKKAISSRLGLFQHFNYFNSDPVKEGGTSKSYRLSESLGLGPGLILRMPNCSPLCKIEQQLYADAVILGGVKSDYYKIAVRDYNMGSGFSFKTKTIACYSHVGKIELNIDYYRLFTWKGWERRDLKNISPIKYNIQGDKSNVEMIIIEPTLFLNIRKNIGIELRSCYYFRHTRYSFHDDVNMKNSEIKIGLSWKY